MSLKLRWIVLCLGIAMAGSLPSNGQTLDVRPKESLADEPLSIKVTGLRPGAPVIVRAKTQDADGRLWQSHAGFYAGDDGSIDLSRVAPVNGDYFDAESMGLLWAMRPTLNEAAALRFRTRGIKPFVIRFSLELNGEEIRSIDVTRRFSLPGLATRQVSQNDLVGKLFLPPGKGPHPGVIFLGGSGGGIGSERDAALLASQGFAVLALAYFGVEGLPEALAEIPLEYFDRAIDWMLRLEGVSSERLAIFGTSKGAEAALLVASRNPRVSAVVGYLPSSVAWSCLCGTDRTSSWSVKGSPIPFVPSGTNPTYAPGRGHPIRAAINYRHRLANEEAAELAAIPVERIRGAVLLVSGRDDELWPSSEMADRIVRRLKEHDHAFPLIHLRYESAGHGIPKAYLPTAGTTLAARGRLIAGGTEAGNARAQAASWPRVVAFLRDALDS